MEQKCLKCGQMNPSNQNFCTNCGNALTPPEAPASDPADGFTSVTPPPAYQAPAPQQWQQAQTPPPAGEWQSPAPGAYQPGYPQYPPYQQAPHYAPSKAKAEFEESKGLFISMINAHKADADSAKTDGEIARRKYPALKLFMTLMRILAWILGIGTLLTGLIGFFANLGSRTWWVGLIMLPIVVLVAFLTFSMCYAGIDFIRLLINTEDNTRRSANK